ncbi:MAG TPA: antibiotic biosynthesis monooxygenase [Stackebrandtia sp.]|jgi:quinol monooxygenase YgiN|uniref:antibiotic biosynthesis monooxygenase family protein n=1 Tax=Stackebrandtia sp. TaxID=2023065 RepID=UPI002D34B826|nr:antibiotic biosynthesis monooxygenase [Stackebrandtia sp.]HZE41369.1 antibiotic biosynthesis monooxygenase [Stackebrandtia sp.]
MLVVNRFDVGDDAGAFRAEVAGALRALSQRPGFVRGHCGPNMDEPGRWVLVTQWDSVGSYRRALSAFDVKMNATPLLSRALVEPSAFEIALAFEAGELTEHDTDRASDDAGAVQR